MKALRIFLLVVLFAVSVYCNDEITNKQLIKLTEWLRTLNGKQAELQKKANEIKASKSKLPLGKGKKNFYIKKFIEELKNMAFVKGKIFFNLIFIFQLAFTTPTVQQTTCAWTWCK